MTLDIKQAYRVIETKIALPLGLSVPEAAYAIYKVALSLMIDAVYLMTIKKGYDPRLFSLAAVGGALPMFAAALAAGIGIRQVVIPELAPVFCAQGLHHAPFQVEVLRSIYERIAEKPNLNWKQIMIELKEQADLEMSRLGIKENLSRYVWSADLKYPDQHHEINIELPSGLADLSIWKQSGQAFHEKHQKLYGYCQPEKSLILVNLRLIVREKERIHWETKEPSTFSRQTNYEMCSVYLQGEFQKIKSYSWRDLRAGMYIKGPAVIKKEFTTIVLENNCSANIDNDGNLLIDIGKDSFE
jgi:N-methylhydantoinase A